MLEPKEISYGNLFAPPVSNLDSRWAKVLGVGDGTPDFEGTVWKPEYPSEGDIVYVMNHGRYTVPAWGEDNLEHFDIASVLDILAIWKEDEMKLIPLGAVVEVELIDPPRKTGDLYLPDSAIPVSGFGKVKTLGLGWRTPTGASVPMQVKEGDIIAFKPLEIMEVDMRPLGVDENRILVTHGNILAVYKENE